MALEITLQRLEEDDVLSLGTKRNCINLLVAASMNTSSVQRAGLGSVPELAVLAAVNLDQFAKRLAPKPWLVEGATPLARQP